MDTNNKLNKRVIYPELSYTITGILFSVYKTSCKITFRLIFPNFGCKILKAPPLIIGSERQKEKPAFLFGTSEPIIQSILHINIVAF